MRVIFSRLVAHQYSVALGRVAPRGDVPVGFMVLATSPLILWLLDGTVSGVALAVMIVALLGCGLVCLSIGQKTHLAYEQADYAIRPKLPFKLLGSAFLACMVAVLAILKMVPFLVVILLGLSVFALCLSAFGMDPMRDKGMDAPAGRLQSLNIALYQGFEARCEDLLCALDAVQDADLYDRTSAKMTALMGLLASMDLTTPALPRVAPSVTKLIDRMQAEVDTLTKTRRSSVTPLQRQRFLRNTQMLIEGFESVARQKGIGPYFDSADVQSDLLFRQLNRTDLTVAN